ncbi:hypothetical protein OS493_033150 [Desmophyllum pertusum]|uniref:Secreted protein n=1 Tax=Desmophyllum pertusum TaxID=174260 RepID=A0A9W9YKH4_9CNID|nr:hypothetical protein OS493_033150 [Desmophyllum pertusum]
MLVLKITLTFVCLCSFGAALPDVFPGCSFMEYFCTARECTSAFYKGLHQDPSADCGKRFESMLTCLKLKIFVCAGRRQMIMIWLTVQIPKIFKKETFCSDANFGIPQNDNVSCSSTYFEKAPLCGKTLRLKFATNRSDASLCSESAKAKKCVKDLLASECTLDAETMEANNLTLSDHNPFCSNNRDPGATGLEVCHDFTNPPYPCLNQNSYSKAPP